MIDLSHAEAFAFSVCCQLVTHDVDIRSAERGSSWHDESRMPRIRKLSCTQQRLHSGEGQDETTIALFGAGGTMNAESGPISRRPMAKWPSVDCCGGCVAKDALLAVDGPGVTASGKASIEELL